MKEPKLDAPLISEAPSSEGAPLGAADRKSKYGVRTGSFGLGVGDECKGREQAGTVPRGAAGFRERFDTGDRVIGTYREQATGRSAPTTVGIIHYDADRGVHIVPARPRGYR